MFLELLFRSSETLERYTFGDSLNLEACCENEKCAWSISTGRMKDYNGSEREERMLKAWSAMHGQRSGAPIEDLDQLYLHEKSRFTISSGGLILFRSPC